MITDVHEVMKTGFLARSFDWLRAIKTCCKTPDKCPPLPAAHFTGVLMRLQKMTLNNPLAGVILISSHL